VNIQVLLKNAFLEEYPYEQFPDPASIVIGDELLKKLWAILDKHQVASDMSCWLRSMRKNRGRDAQNSAAKST